MFKRHLFLALFIGSTSVVAFSQTGKDTLLKYTKTWYVEFNLDINERKPMVETQDGAKLMGYCNLHVHGGFPLEITKDGEGNEMLNDDGTISIWENQFSSEGSYYGESYIQDTDGIGEETYIGSGTFENGYADLAFNYDDNTYQLQLNTGELPYTIVRDFHQADEYKAELSKNSDPVSQVFALLMTVPDSLRKGEAKLSLDLFTTISRLSDGTLIVDKQKLPTSGRVLQGSVSLPLLSWFTGTFSWKISPGKSIDRKLTITTQNEADYHAWLPLHESNSGYKPLMVRATLDMSNTKTKEDSLVFSLMEVSNYKGYNGNEPSINSADETADLVFAPQSEQPLGIIFIDSFHVTTHKKAKYADVKIICRDYAAYGNLKVKAVNQNIVGTSKYDNKPFLVIPEDGNANKIADYWESTVGMQQLDVKWDEDKYPENQGSSGDGLSFFEEYRGFGTKEDIHYSGKLERTGMHVRTDPNHKDVFIYDQTEMFKKYYEPVNPSQTNWHLTNRSQLNYTGDETDLANRQINFNSPQKLRNNYQYGLCLMFLPMTDFSTAGQAVYRKGKNPDASIQYCDFIWLHNESVYIDTIKKRCPGTFSYDQQMQIAKNQYEATVIHEIGHAIGIMHHSNGDAKYIDGNGNEVHLVKANALMNDDYHKALARQGVPSCALTYTFVDIREFKGSRIFNRQTKYCIKGEKYVDDFFQQRESDNCFGQIKIKCN